jgi:hypothetical protein
MALQLTAPIKKEFHLEETDKLFENDGDPTRVIVRQATQSHHERRSDLWAELKQRVMDDDSVIMIQHLSIPELHRIEVFCTFSACNIAAEDGEALFKFKNGELDMTEAQFTKAWGKLPPQVAAEIHLKVLEVNPTWKPRGEAL